MQHNLEILADCECRFADFVCFICEISALHFQHVPESMVCAILSITEGHKLCVRCGSDVFDATHIKSVSCLTSFSVASPQVGVDVSLARGRGTITRPQQKRKRRKVAWRTATVTWGGSEEFTNGPEPLVLALASVDVYYMWQVRHR